MSAPQRTAVFAMIRWACGMAGALAVLAHAEGFTPKIPGALPELDVSAQSLPRFDAADGGMRTDRVTLAIAPPASPVAATFGLSNSPPGPLAFGGQAAATAVDIGMRWRWQGEAHHSIDVSAWRRMAQSATLDAQSLIDAREPTYGARIEMGMSARSPRGFVTDRKSLGFQLDGASRIGIRRYNRGPMLYWRNDF